MNGVVLGFKLFVSVLVVSDTGSVASSSFATGIPTLQQCRYLMNEFNRSNESKVNGHNLTIIVKSDCVPMQSALTSDVPPPIADMINGLINGLQQ